MAMGLHTSSRGRSRSSRRAPMAEINVTPLVDVMLVLLIIFMVTAPLLASGVPVELPDSRANALDQQPDQVIISVDRDGFIYIDDGLVEEGGFATAIGLFAAIPAVIAYNRLSHRVNGYEAHLGRFADQVHAQVGRELERS